MNESHPSTAHPTTTTAEPGEPGCAGGLTVLDPPGLPGPADAPENPVDDRTAPSAAVQDRLAGRLSDITSLHEHTERLARARGLSATLDTVLASGAALLGARRGVLVTRLPGGGPGQPIGLHLDRASLGALETVPTEQSLLARLLREHDRPEQLHSPDLVTDPAIGAPPNRPRAGANSPATTARSPPRCSPSSWRRTGSCAPPRRCAAVCCPTGSPGPAACGWPPGSSRPGWNAPAAATGTTRSRCPTAPSA